MQREHLTKLKRRNQEKLRELEARCNANEAASQMCFHALFAVTGLKTSNMVIFTTN
jgi:hypothetical protein